MFFFFIFITDFIPCHVYVFRHVTFPGMRTVPDEMPIGSTTFACQTFSIHQLDSYFGRHHYHAYHYHYQYQYHRCTCWSFFSRTSYLLCPCCTCSVGSTLIAPADNPPTPTPPFVLPLNFLTTSWFLVCSNRVFLFSKFIPVNTRSFSSWVIPAHYVTLQFERQHFRGGRG